MLTWCFQCDFIAVRVSDSMQTLVINSLLGISTSSVTSTC